MGDHPRSRGVYWGNQVREPEIDGSSPLARGLLATTYCAEADLGIIPARAGFTHKHSSFVRKVSDHPRSRGVYTGNPVEARPELGSSPLARGLLAVATIMLRDVGIIPARAGFTRQRLILVIRAGDHPRSRGVYPTPVVSLLEIMGSSPLARGLRWHTAVNGQCSGIIPARAGFTETDHRSGRKSRDHPRSRGVYSFLTLSRDALPGSSPLARGLRHKGTQRCTAYGIIPARAGFTKVYLGGIT